MKKITTFFLAAIMLFALSVPTFAEETELKKSISAANKFLTDEAPDAETFDETLSFAEAGLIGEKTKIYIVKADESDAQKLAEYILLKKAFGESVLLSENSKEDYGDRLILLQKDDGSFGDIKASVYSVAALFATGKKTIKNAKKPYKEADAVNFIISSQNEDGSIGDRDVSVKAAAVLRQYSSSENAAQALDKLEKYFIALTESEAPEDVAAGLCGLTDKNYGKTTAEMTAAINKLIALQNEDGGFSAVQGEKSDLKLTKKIFEALESVRYTVTPFNAVTNGVKFANTGIDFSALKPMIILYAVLVVCSIGVWIFIMKRNPKRGTLEDAKRLAEEKLNKTEEK